eukprot:TRINITY_DN736_c2_g1_i1.p1 TRINITY_DN736_c2_g1~~TRINITY_DN736_c2_g1_i1.p1  ORF type:complete len:161 (+),score=34.90 TRINITY_DN736_c2_g1_i1:57-485(+)
MPKLGQILITKRSNATTEIDGAKILAMVQKWGTMVDEAKEGTAPVVKRRLLGEIDGMLKRGVVLLPPLKNERPELKRPASHLDRHYAKKYLSSFLMDHSPREPQSALTASIKCLKNGILNLPYTDYNGRLYYPNGVQGRSVA